jgi:hypothetical protein
VQRRHAGFVQDDVVVPREVEELLHPPLPSQNQQTLKPTKRRLIEHHRLLTSAGTDNRSKGTDNRSKGTDNRSKGTDNRSKGTDNRSKGTDNRSKGTDNRSKGTSLREDALLGELADLGRVVQVVRLRWVRGTQGVLTVRLRVQFGRPREGLNPTPPHDLQRKAR